MEHILNAKNFFKEARLGSSEARLGPIKMAHDWAKSGNTTGLRIQY